MKTRKKGLWKIFAIIFVALIVIQSLTSGGNTVFADVTTLHCLNVWTSENMVVYKNATDTVSHPQIMYVSGTEKPVFCIDLGKAAATGDTLTSKEQADYTRLNDKQKQAIGYVLGSNAQLSPPIGAANGYAGADYTDTAVQQQMKWFWSTQLMIWYFIDYYDDETVDCGGMNWAGVENTCNAGWGDLTECNRIWYYVINMMRIPSFAVDYYEVDDANTPSYEMTWNNSSNQYEVILHHTDAESRVMAHYEEANGKLHYIVCNADGTPNDDGEYLKVYTTEAIAQDSALETWGYKEGKLNKYVFDVNDSNPQDGCEAGIIIDAPKIWFKFKVYTAGESDLTISKKDITTQEELPGCTLSVTSTDGSITYDTWVSTNIPHPITGLETGTYVLHELIPASGFTVANDVTFTYDKASNTAQAVTMYNSKTRVELLKMDASGNPLAGAKLEVRRADGSFVESWTSGATSHVIEGLPAGNYILRETQAPVGYTLAADKPFTVTSVNQTVAVTMADRKTRVELLKMDASGNPLAGAKLEVRRADGSFVESWTSGATAHVIEGLPEGNYVLKETQAPVGYTLAADKPFTVTSVNQTVIVTMADKKTRVELLKTDEAGNLLAGAKLEVRKADGSFVESWTSGATAHVIEGLPAGNYVLKETQAPVGYTLAADKPFTVTSVNQTVIVTMADKKTHIELLKTDEAGNSLAGAKLEVRKADGSFVESWTSGTTAHVIEGLPAGNYVLKETQAPVGYTLAADVSFTVTQANQSVIVSMVDTETIVEFIKLDEEGNVLSGASLELYDSQNNLVDSWVSTSEYHTIKNLPQGVYRLHEAKAPEGWTLAEDITFSITENPETVTIKMSDRRIYGNFKLTKTSLQIPDKRLGGATFSLYQTFGGGTEDKYLGDYVTDKNGEIYIEHLVYGDYYLKEIEANEHYYLNTEKCEFEILVDGETVNANYVNTAIVGVLHVRYDNKFTRGQFVAGTPRTGDVKCPELAMAILMMMLAIGAKEIITHKKR